MTITENTALYEVLVRFDPGGALAGAHQQRRSIVTLDDGSTIERLLPPEALDIAGLAASGVMQETCSTALAQVQQLTADATTLANGYNELQDQLATANASIASLQAAALVLQARIDELETPPAAPQTENALSGDQPEDGAA